MSLVPVDTRITIERDLTRPGWLCIVAERGRRPRRLWLAIDEAAQVHALLGRELPAIKTRRPAGPARSDGPNA